MRITSCNIIYIYVCVSKLNCVSEAAVIHALKLSILVGEGALRSVRSHYLCSRHGVATSITKANPYFVTKQICEQVISRKAYNCM